MAERNANDSQTSFRKAAILISVLDARAADALLDKMGPDRAARVRNAVLELDGVSEAEQRQVISEFMNAGEPAPINPAAGIELDDSLAHRLATQSTPVAEELTNHSRDAEPPPFRFLHEATSDALARHLVGEHPQIIAVVVAHLPPKRAADLVKRLPERLQVDVLRRVAELDAADPEILRALERELELLLSDDIRAARNRSTGVSTVSSILDAAGTERGDLLRNVSQHDHQLLSLVASAARETSERPIGSHDFLPQHHRDERAGTPREATAKADAQGPPPATSDKDPVDGGPGTAECVSSEAEPLTIPFDDLVRLDDQSLAALFRAADPQLILLALTGASEVLVKRIMRQLTGREAKALRRRLERIGPLRLTDVEQAQLDIARLASQLAKRGVIRQPEAKRFAIAA